MISYNYKLAALFKNMKVSFSKVSGILVFVFLGFLNGNANPEVADYYMYEAWYAVTGSMGVFQFEKGYSLINIWFYRHDFQYYQFREFLAMMAAIVMCIAVYRFTENILPVALLYGFSTFFADAIQIRSQLMLAFVMLGLSFLKKIDLKNILISFAFIFISTYFHTSGYFFVLIIFLRCLSEKKLRKLGSYLLMFELPLAILFFAFKEKILTIVADSVSLISSRISLTDKITTRYTTGTSKGELLAIFAITVVTLALTVFMTFYSNSKVKEDYFYKSLTLYAVSIFSVATTPFLVFSVDYSRIQRAAFMFFLIHVGLFLEKNKSLQVKLFVGVSAIIISVFAYFIFLKVYGEFVFNSIPLFWKGRN